MNPNTLAQYANYMLSVSQGGTGSGALVTAELSEEGSLRTVTIANGGLNYNIGDLIVPISSGSSGGVIEVLDITSNGTVIKIKIRNVGTGYTNASGLLTSGGIGTGLTINCTAGHSIRTVTVINGGTNYFSAKAIISNNIGDVSADLTVNVSLGIITSVTVNNGGNYILPPLINIVAGRTFGNE